MTILAVVRLAQRLSVRCHYHSNVKRFNIGKSLKAATLNEMAVDLICQEAIANGESASAVASAVKMYDSEIGKKKIEVV